MRTSMSIQQAALCTVELAAGQPPEWVEIIPAGPRVTGRDGRSWVFGLAEGQAVVTAFSSNGGPLPVDWEHATEYRAPKGREAPAAGWITALELRNGALWGRIDWTPRAAAQISRREYRFLSPVFLFGKNSGSILKLVSVALTNNPNLYLAALNQVTPGMGQTPIIPPVPYLTAEQQAICQMMGNDPEDVRKNMQAEVERGLAVERLTPDQLKVCHSFGISPEDYLNNKEKENG